MSALEEILARLAEAAADVEVHRDRAAAMHFESLHAELVGKAKGLDLARCVVLAVMQPNDRTEPPA